MALPSALATDEAGDPAPEEALAAALTRQHELPAAVRATVRRFVLDSLGVILAARDAPGMARLAAAMQALDPAPGPATELLGGRSVSGPTAALLNGAAAHALEFDDTEDVARIHAYCTVVPVAMAVAEMERGTTVGQMLDAIAIGAELICRLGHACPDLLSDGWHPTTSLGGIAAAATAARLLSLDAARTTHAMAIAYAQLCGNNQSIADNALSKRAGPGFAARNGLTAAYLARHEVSGPLRFLTGSAGLFAMYAGPGARPEALADAIGTSWFLERLSIKPFPCCRCTHALIKLGIDLNADGILPDEVAGGTLLLGRVNWGIVGGRFQPEAAANPVVHAQFNACYTFARALRDGGVTLETFRPETILAESSGEANNYVCRESDDIAPDSLSQAEVRLELKDGRHVAVRADKLPGSPEAPLDDHEIRKKFVRCLETGRQVGAAEAAKLADLILGVQDASPSEALMSEMSRIAGRG